MNRLLHFMFSLLLSVCTVQGQTVIWSMNPADYEKITLLNEGLYKVERDGRNGLISPDGTVILPLDNYDFGQFYDGRALITQDDEHGEKIVACLTESGRVYRFPKAYYTLSGQKFYSDNLLSVANKEGLVGYIDERGNDVLGFSVDFYDRIKPFVDGYAAVFKEQEYSLIDKSGTPVKFLFKSIGKLRGGTNPFNGQVYVWDKKRYYTYNLGSGGVCQRVETPADVNQYDYLFRFSCITGQPALTPFKEARQYNGIKGPEPIEKRGKYGFNVEGELVLPCQFDEATGFSDNYAVVRIGRRYGILKYIPEGTFVLTYSTDSIPYSEGDTIDYVSALKVPPVWKDESLSIDITKKPEGSSVIYHKDGKEFHILLCPKDEERIDYQLHVNCNGLLLFEKDFSCFLEKLEVEVADTMISDSLIFVTDTIAEMPPEIDTQTTQRKKVERKSSRKQKPKPTPKPKPKPVGAIRCKKCGKRLSDCPYQGVH